MQNTSDKFLPVGTVVLLKGGKKRLMVTGFLVTEANKDKTWDYCGCLYPEGILGSNQTALFNHDQIETIYHYGLIDEEEQSFQQQIKLLLNTQKTTDNFVTTANTTNTVTTENDSITSETNNENNSL